MPAAQRPTSTPRKTAEIARQSWSAGGTAYQMDFIYDAAGRPLAMYYRTKAAGQDGL